MNFTTPSLVEQVIWDMRTADWPRAENRANIDRLFGGFPPWTPAEAESAQIQTNVNFLDAPKLAADARRSYYNAFLKPSVFFTMNLEAGDHRHREHWSAIVTKEINRIMKESVVYFEVLRSQVASTVLHGIGPVTWCDAFGWKPKCVDIPHLLIPSDTLLSAENLNHLAMFRRYTAPELSDKIERKHSDPGWNKTLARKAVAWCHKQVSGQDPSYTTLAPERIVEQIKQDGVYYSSDRAPTVDCWDFFYRSDEGGKSGWRRRMVLDTPFSYEVGSTFRAGKNKIGEPNGEWLYSSGNRVYAEDLSQILHFQFGDLSAKSPFHYHSVRSLGWLIYAVCNLQNRLKCKLNDAAFENLMNYFRVANPDDADRLTKIDLHNYGVVPDGVEFVKQGDRWQINHAFIQNTIQDNRQQMNEAASQFREGRDTTSTKEKTATEIMAEVNAANALVGTMLLLAYTYQKAQYIEIARRFFKPNSPDKDVRTFRARVLKQGVPLDLLDMEFWTLAPEQVLGSGNKVLQVAMADKLMAIRPLLDPQGQRDVLRMYIQANSDDPNLSMRWVPAKPILVSDSEYNAQRSIGTLMAGASVSPHAGEDAGQVVKALLVGMAEIAKRINSTTQLPTESEFFGLMNLGQTIQKYLELFAQDPGQQDQAKKYAAALADLSKMVEVWGKQLAEQKQQQGGGNPEAAKEAQTTQVKLQGMQLTAQTKAQIAAANAQQKQQQREAQFRQKQRQQEEQHTAELRKKLRETKVNTAISDAKAATDIQNSRRKSAAESQNKPNE